MLEASETNQDGVPRMFVMVGLSASGKTRRARELASAWSALRLTPIARSAERSSLPHTPKSSSGGGFRLDP
jgi:hypothetical protein